MWSQFTGVDEAQVTILRGVGVKSELGRLAHWDGLVAELSTAVMVTDIEGRAVIWNRAATALFGWSADDVLGRPALGVLMARELEVDAVAVLAAVAAGCPWSGELECNRRDGSPVLVDLTMSTLYDDERRAIGFVGEARASSDLLRDLRAADARQKAIVARSRDATLFFDPDGTIRWASPVAVDLLGIDPDSLIGQNGLDFIHVDDQERVLADFMTMTSLGDHVRTEFRVIDTGGETRWLEEDVTHLVDDPDIGYIVGNVREITDRKHAQGQLERLALYDPLTGLPNRTLLINRLEQLLNRGSDAAVIHIDIDNFGDVNDALGHAAGDALLVLVGARFARVMEGTASTLSHVGGDEFVLLCDDVGDAITAFAHAERLRECLREPIALDGEERTVSVSVGVALTTANADTPCLATGLLRDAGNATNQAKQLGRDRVIGFDTRLEVTQQRRLAIQNELRHALTHDELVVWYQPIVDLRTDRIGGVEALVRWNHPRHGLIGPDQFIDVAESSGLARAVGNRVLRKACADAQIWQQRGSRFRVSVNASAGQLSSREFVAELEAMLIEFHLDPRRITIEITETAAMQIVDSLENLQHIRALGVHLALDDFGTGYSSLTFLRELPVDAIKIDRSFVSGLGSNPRDSSIVEGVIAMASAFGYAVVGEGVETTAQADILRRLGCGYAQGFLWSPAVPAAEIQALAARASARSTRS